MRWESSTVDGLWRPCMLPVEFSQHLLMVSMEQVRSPLLLLSSTDCLEPRFMLTCQIGQI